LPRFKARILKVNQIKVTVVTRTDERLVLCEDKGLLGTAIFRDSYSHNHAVLITQPVDGQNFCRNGGHWSWLWRLAGGLAKSLSFYIGSSSTSLNLRASADGVNGFCKSANPLFKRP
jgi:hypothetical protein